MNPPLPGPKEIVNVVKRKIISKQWSIFSTCLASLFWIWLGISLLCPHLVDSIKISLGSYDWLVEYEIIVFAAVLGAVWIFAGNSAFSAICFKIVFYPFLLVAKISWKNRVLLISLSPLIYGFLKSFRNIFLISTGFVVGFLLIVNGRLPWQIQAGMCITSVSLLIFLYRQFNSALESKTFFGVAAEAVKSNWQKLKISTLLQIPLEARGLNTEDEKSKFAVPLIFAYSFFMTFHRLAEATQVMAKSRKLEFFLVCSWLWIYSINTIGFGLIYYSISRLNAAAFSGGSDLLDFIGYSICVNLTSSVSDIHAISSLAKGASYAELLIFVVILIVLVTLIWGNRRERYKNDLSKTSEQMDSIYNEFDLFFVNNYQLTVRAAERWLLDHNEIICGWLLRQRYGRNHVKDIQIQLIEEVPLHKGNKQKGASKKVTKTTAAKHHKPS